MPEETRLLCPDCSAPLEEQGMCMACVFDEALAAKTAGGSLEAEGRFSHYAPQEAGTFGKYVLRRRLGSGGMGVIWEAEEKLVRRVVALKMIRGFAFSSEADLLRFRTETQAVAQLDHPHIVPVYEVGEAEGQPYFTMKLLKGDTLAQRLVAGALSVRDAAGIMEKLAQAVHHAHERGVLHRDLKPGNVLFDQAGKPYLTDFGLAKLVDTEQGLTLTNAQVGTPHYMSPEQARGRARDVTTASDVWALGAMFYQMLTGRLPFPGSSPSEIFGKVAHQEPVPLRTLAASADSDLETLCLRCLEKDPTRRLPGAGVLVDELARWRRGEPIRSRRVTGRERALRWARRHPWRVAAAAALVLSLLAGTIISLVLWRSAEASSALARQHAAAERMTGYVSTMAAALAARERHDFSRARQLLEAAPAEHRGFEWRLLSQLCAGDQRSLLSLSGGGGPETFSLGPDQESLAIVTRSGALHLVSPDGLELRRPRLLPPTSGTPDPAKLNPRNYHSLSYSPGGRYFSCSFRNTIRVFDAETLEVLTERPGIVQVQSAWLDDKRLIYGYDTSTSMAPEMGVWMFDTESRTTVQLPPQWTAPLAVSGDRATVALTGGGSYDVAIFRVADLAGAEPLKDAVPVAHWRPASPGSGNVLALSPDGKYLAALCGPQDDPAHYLEVAETATGRVCLTQGFREALSGLAFHPSEPLIAVSGTDAAVRLFHFLMPVPEDGGTYDDDCAWSIREPLNGNGPHSPPRRLLTRSSQNGRAVFLLGHEGRGEGVLFSTDGNSLFTAAADDTVRCWTPATPVPATRISNVHLLQMELHPSVSPDGTRLLYSTGELAARYWREDRGDTLLAEDHMPLAVLPAGRVATMERSTSDIILWQEDGDSIIETGRIRGPGYIQGFTELLRGVVFPDGQRIAGITRGRVFVADLETQTVTATEDQGWETGPSRAWGIAVSPDGRQIVATGLGRRVRLYDPSDLTKPAPPIGESHGYDTALAFHPDGRRLYCGNEDGMVRVLETTTWTELTDEAWQAHSGPVTAIALSNDARLIATAGDTTMKLWLTEKTAGATRIELLSFTTYFPAAWLHFGRGANGEDHSLLHVEPFCPLEIWPASLDPAGVSALGALKVLRKP